MTQQTTGESQPSSDRPRVVIVGGGITGLSTAHRLGELDPAVKAVVLEASGRAGGVLRTAADQGFLIEESADSFLTAVPDGVNLCRRLGLDEELIPTDPRFRRAFVVCRGKLEPIPDGLLIMAPTRFWPMLATPVLSLRGKLRMGLEYWVPRGSQADESLASFATRRFGREAFDRLIQPLVGGMYTGDPHRLSVQATMPRFPQMEASHGSLIRAAVRQRSAQAQGQGAGSGARYGLFAGLRGGMSSLVDALLRNLPSGTVHCGVKAQRLERAASGRWLVQADGAEGGRLYEADAVILATPVRAAAALLADVDSGLAANLFRVESTSCAIVSLAYRRVQVAHALDGFGFVVPKVENRAILSGSFSSVKFPGRAPEGMVLFRAFLGGAFRPELLDQDDKALCALAAGELAALLGITGDPLLRRVSRWVDVMPQYEIGHVDLVSAIESSVSKLPGLAIAGNAYHG
ncbi:MAG TPA: protoporphyrinogen oxidase, partial [Isosphaeraceae bacterium]|nr:protoporphyrinogen oxidase [Isosphaeraceae bacterium]